VILTFDIETNGLVRSFDHIHCLVIQDVETGEVWRFNDEPDSKAYSVQTGVKDFLMEADEIWGHNIVNFDIPAIQRLYPYFKECEAKVRDTLILSRMFFTDILDRDLASKPRDMPPNLYGRHSLESWGYRLKFRKGEFGKTCDWKVYSREMEDYCEQDVRVTTKLVQMFRPKVNLYTDPIWLEHECQRIMAEQEQSGFPFDVEAAQRLENKLRSEIEKLSDEMTSKYMYVQGAEFTPKRDNKRQGYVANCPFTKLKDFNPGSRDHIAWIFTTLHGHTFTELTETGKAKIDDTVLRAVGHPDADKFARIMELRKFLGLLSEGDNSWLKLVESDGRLHHSCILNTATGRNAHNRPNLAQVPSGHEYRELFKPGDGRLLVGSDASGLELRCLAHYLAPYDDGAFGTELLEGDIHTRLAEIYGTDRKNGKTVTYCMIYGGGNAKLGLAAGATKAKAVARGKAIRKAVMDGLTGFKELMDAVSSKAETGQIRGLDGRIIRIKKPHAALNYLLQSAGAIICKNWVVNMNHYFRGMDVQHCAFVHDEVQLSIAPDLLPKVTEILHQSMTDVQSLFQFRIELACEVVSGDSWGATH